MDELDEAELKAMTTNMYQKGGAQNVIDCVLTMQRCQILIMKKLNELIDEEIDEKK